MLGPRHRGRQRVPFNLRPLDQPLPRALSYGILGLMGRTPVQVEQRLIDFFSAKARWC